MIYRFLKSEDFDAVYETFLEAFSDYQVKVQMSKEQFEAMNIRRGLKYELSVGAFDDSNEMVGLLLTGLDLWEGKSTAYDMGTGVIPKFRRKGIGDNMVDFLLPALQKAKVKQYLLEVIRSNEKAHKLYKKKGFKETREFECFKVSSAELRTKNTTRKNLIFEEIKKPAWNIFETFWDFRPSWQNSNNSMKRCQKEKIILGVFHKKQLQGYGILYPESGEITQIAIDKDARRRGIGSLLMREIAKRAEKAETLFILNVEKSSKETISFLKEANFENSIGQYEMILKL
ncbi:MAG: GNAT family N-acetyltransferase [Candidatus Bathyarchaeota archaeon]